MKFRVLLFLGLSLFLLKENAASESLFSVGAGSLYPAEKILSDSDTGYNISGSFIYQKNSLFAYGTDFILSRREENKKDKLKNKNKAEISTFGIETYLYIQPKLNKFQPFAGIGLGIYGNNITGEYNGTEYYDVSETKIGAASKCGLRFYMENYFFISGYIKYYFNPQDFQYHDDENKKNKNMGGTCLMFETGIRFS